MYDTQMFPYHSANIRCSQYIGLIMAEVKGKYLFNECECKFVFRVSLKNAKAADRKEVIQYV